MRILLLYKGYPRISHGYQIYEANELNKKHEVMIISFDWELFTKAKNHLPFILNSPLNELNRIMKFKPDIIYSHFLETFDLCVRLSNTLKIPFTIKSHSFDILGNDFSTPKKYARAINQNKWCLKIIVFPEFVDKLLTFGISSSKLLPMYPTIPVSHFIKLEMENGPHIMSGGAFLPKKNITGFILLSKKIKAMYPEKQITYYSVNENQIYYDQIMQFNKLHDNPVNFITVQPEQMPLEYKKHQWLVYTACPVKKTVGNPLMIAEAQASGVGVIMFNLRSTLKDYVTDDGYLYNTDDEVLEIISRDFDSEKKRRLIELSKQRYDVEDKMKEIESLWV
jgi:hypothetical protein